MLIDTCLIPFESKKHCFKTLNNNFQNCLYFHFRKFFQEFLVISSDSSQIVVEDNPNNSEIISMPKSAKELEDAIERVYLKRYHTPNLSRPLRQRNSHI